MYKRKPLNFQGLYNYIVNLQENPKLNKEQESELIEELKLQDKEALESLKFQVTSREYYNITELALFSGWDKVVKFLLKEKKIQPTRTIFEATRIINDKPTPLFQANTPQDVLFADENTSEPKLIKIAELKQKFSFTTWTNSIHAPAQLVTFLKPHGSEFYYEDTDLLSKIKNF